MFQTLFYVSETAQLCSERFLGVIYNPRMTFFAKTGLTEILVHNRYNPLKVVDNPKGYLSKAKTICQKYCLIFLMHFSNVFPLNNIILKECGIMDPP